jgi:hemerythrin
MHTAFIATFQKLSSDLEKNGATSSLVIDVNVKVGEWLKNHIAETDKQLGAFLKN